MTKPAKVTDHPDTMHEDDKLALAQAIQKHYTLKLFDLSIDIDNLAKTITIHPKGTV